MKSFYLEEFPILSDNNKMLYHLSSWVLVSLCYSQNIQIPVWYCDIVRYLKLMEGRLGFDMLEREGQGERWSEAVARVVVAQFLGIVGSVVWEEAPVADPWLSSLNLFLDWITRCQCNVSDVPISFNHWEWCQCDCHTSGVGALIFCLLFNFDPLKFYLLRKQFHIFAQFSIAHSRW